MNNFNKVYERIYQEVSQNKLKNELENERTKQIRKHIIICVLCVIALIACFFMFYSPAFMLTISLIILVAASIHRAINRYSKLSPPNRAKPNSRYNILYKKEVISKLVKYADDSFEFTYYKGFPKEKYQSGGFITGNIYSSEDYIRGNLNDSTQFEMADTTVGNETTDDEGRKNTVYYFVGLLGIFNLDNSIGCSLKVTMDRDEQLNLIKGPDYISTDSQEFEKKYNVYCRDKIMAMRILTADVMDNLLKIGNEYKIKVDFSIRYNMVYVRFHNNGLFEGPLKKQSLDYEVLLNYYNQINAMYKVMTLLNNTITSKFE